MFKTIESKLATLRLGVSEVHENSERLDALQINQGILLAALNQAKHSSNLKDYEFKVFSQWGEDGILQRLTSAIEIPEKTFIEFGVEDFFESNCRFLMMKDNWRGFVMDGSAANIGRLQRAYFYWKYELTAVEAFITRENINELLAKSGFGPDLGILSVDIDGNDYYVWEATEEFRPSLVMIEFNPTMSNSILFVQKKDPGVKHGSSAASIVELAGRKGYELVAATEANLLFVKREFYAAFDIADNSLPLIRDDSGVPQLFIGFDGHVFLSQANAPAAVPMPWHGIEIRETDVQVLPRRLQKFPGDYTRAERFLFRLRFGFKRPRRFLRRLLRRGDRQ